jgi:hypothetical protein
MFLRNIRERDKKNSDTDIFFGGTPARAEKPALNNITANKSGFSIFAIRPIAFIRQFH